MIQIDGTKRQVFIKSRDEQYVHDLLKTTNGATEYKHSAGIISTVKLEIAGLGTRRIRIANLPPELPETTIRAALTPYGKIHMIHEENW
jgi:hypothetical protein